MLNKPTPTQRETRILFAPKNEVPRHAPKMPAFGTDTTLEDLFPPNYLSAEFVERVGELTLTVKELSLEFVEGHDANQNGEWKMCVSFSEITSLLVLNKTRAEQLATITQSSRVLDWKLAGKIQVFAGVDAKYKKFQLLIAPATESDFVKNVNDELFGED